MALLKTNNVYVSGELVEVKDYKTGVYGDDKNYVTATIVIKSIVDGVEMLTEARTFVSELKADGSVNKNYNTVLNINNLLNKRVVISGATLKGERFWSQRTSQLANMARINFTFIRLANLTDKEDKATFEFGGFVTRPLTEVLDKDGNPKYYQITLGQANFKEDNMHEVNFAVAADNIGAIRAIEASYEVGATVRISGKCQSIVTIREVETEVAFGEPIVKKYTNIDKKFIITSGSAPVEEGGEGEYDKAAIDKLVAAYTAEGKEIQAKTASGDKGVAETPKTKSKASSLAGLI